MSERDAFAQAEQATRDAFEAGREAGRAEVFAELGGRALPTLLTSALADAMDAIGSRLHAHDANLGRMLRAFGDDLRAAGATPKVVQRSHAGGMVALTFSDDMDAAGLPNHVTVRNANGGHPLKVTPSWDAAARTLTLTPARPFEPGTRYQVQVSGDARSLSGVPLEAHEHEFTAR